MKIVIDDVAVSLIDGPFKRVTLKHVVVSCFVHEVHEITLKKMFFT